MTDRLTIYGCRSCGYSLLDFCSTTIYFQKAGVKESICHACNEMLIEVLVKNGFQIAKPAEEPICTCWLTPLAEEEG
jgi:hypothetical protein